MSEEFTPTDYSVTTPVVSYKRSPELTKLAPALAKAMGAMGAAAKDSQNPHFKSKYADLASCHGAAIGPLTDNGFSFPMFPRIEPASSGGVVVTVTALLLHESGEYFEGSIEIPSKDTHAQAIGSAMTYGRRYLYCMVGIVPDDDDDGNAAVGRGQQQSQGPRREAPAAPPKKAEPKPVQQSSAGPVTQVDDSTVRPVAKSEPPPPPKVDPARKDEPSQHERIKALFLEHGFKGTGKSGPFVKAIIGKTPQEMSLYSEAQKVISALEDEETRQRTIEAIGGLS